ncbi:hypothetical protein J4731_03555 [Providencia rettgeri]|nr:hypothetical protein [Providencia rettgeri]
MAALEREYQQAKHHLHEQQASFTQLQSELLLVEERLKTKRNNLMSSKRT